MYTYHLTTSPQRTNILGFFGGKNIQNLFAPPSYPDALKWFRGQCAGPPGAVVALCVRDVLGAGRFPAIGELAEEE